MLPGSTRLVRTLRPTICAPLTALAADKHRIMTVKLDDNFGQHRPSSRSGPKSFDDRTRLPIYDLIRKGDLAKPMQPTSIKCKLEAMLDRYDRRR